MKVLVVDDSSDLAEQVAELLREEGHAVEVDDGREPEVLVDRLGREGFELVLLDLGLGLHHGAEVVHALRERDEGPRVVLCTGADESVVAPLRSLVAGVLRKPFGLNELFAALEVEGPLTFEGRRTDVQSSGPPSSEQCGV